MRVRLLGAAAAIALLGTGCGSPKTLDIWAAKNAFADQGVQFKQLSTDRHQIDVIESALLHSKGEEPKLFLDHTQSAGLSFKPTTRYRVLCVFDDSAWATKFAAFSRKAPGLKGYVAAILVARNVVYIGTGDEAARRAMNSLRK